MGSINTMGPLCEAWYDLLNGQLTHGGEDVQVVMDDDEVEEITSDHWVLIRGESEGDLSNKRAFVDDLIVVVDIITTHTNNIDGSIVESIDGQIKSLVKPGEPGSNGLTNPTGMQIVMVKRESVNYLKEKDDTYKYHRKVSRYGHRVLQTDSSGDFIITETGNIFITEDSNSVILE